MLFNLGFASNTILSCFFLFFLTIDLNFLITAVIAQVFKPIAEPVSPIGTPTKESKVEMITHPVIIEIIIRKWSI